MPTPISQERIESIVDIMKTIGEESEDDALGPLKTKARWAARRLGLFFDMKNALIAGLPDGETEVTDDDHANFEQVMALHPDLPTVIAGFQGEPDAYEAFTEMMTTLMGHARADDTHMVKYNIKDWIPVNPSQEPLERPIVGTKKDNRGWYNKETARALTPLRLLNQFDANPVEFMQKVENGTIRITAKDYPSFLYPAGAVYNRQDPSEGLFRGEIFIRTLHTIYTGLSSALDGYRAAPKESQGEINGMKEVFAEAVSSSAIHAHFALSSLANWSEIEKSDFDYFQFSGHCALLFTEDPEDEWVVDTLKFLTSQLPSLRRRRKHTRNAEENGDDDVEDETLIILMRRAALRAAREREAREQEENEARVRQENEAHEERPAGEQEREFEDDLRQAGERQLTPPPSSQAPINNFTPFSSSPTPQRAPPPSSRSPSCHPAVSRRSLASTAFRVISRAPNSSESSGSGAQQDSVHAADAPPAASTSRVQQPAASTSAKVTASRSKSKSKKGKKPRW